MSIHDLWLRSIGCAITAKKVTKKLGVPSSDLFFFIEVFFYSIGHQGRHFEKLCRLILDVIREPGMDGLETCGRILAYRPGQKAIIVSIFSERFRFREAQRLGAGRYLRKPYSLEDFRSAGKMELRDGPLHI